MRSRWKKTGLLFCGLGCLLSAAGCTESDLLTAGNGTLRVTLRFPNDAHTRFETAFFQVTQIQMRPTDPEADAALGPLSYTLLDPSLPSGVYNVAGVTVGPLSKFLDERGIKPVSVPGPALRLFNRAQRVLGMTRYHAGFHPRRLFYSLVLDDNRFEKIFRANAHRAEQ